MHFEQRIVLEISVVKRVVKKFEIFRFLINTRVSDFIIRYE